MKKRTITIETLQEEYQKSSKSCARYYADCYTYIDRFFESNAEATQQGYYLIDDTEVTGHRGHLYTIRGIAKPTFDYGASKVKYHYYLVESTDIDKAEPVYIEDINKEDLIKILTLLPVNNNE